MKTKKTEQTGKSRSAVDWVYGLNPVLESIKAGRKIGRIILSSGRQQKISGIREAAESRNIPVEIVEPDFFHRFKKGHQGIAAEVSPKEYVLLDHLLDIPSEKNENPLFLILDCIEDPRNMGAILRVADAAGIHGVVLQAYRAVTLSAEVAKVSAGAIEHVPVSVMSNVKHAIREMKERGITVIGADSDAERVLWDVDFTVPAALVVGSEGKGLRPTVRKLCDMSARIPMKGKINSLNVSVAAGILAFEILRQRTQKNLKIVENNT